MTKQQKICKGTNDSLFLFIRSRFVEDLKLKGGEKFCMKKGRGRQLIIDFDCEEEE
jgi:hypothetical protein